jgi:hypothetical protein
MKHKKAPIIRRPVGRPPKQKLIDRLHPAEAMLVRGHTAFAIEKAEYVDRYRSGGRLPLPCDGWFDGQRILFAHAKPKDEDRFLARMDIVAENVYRLLGISVWQVTESGLL